MAKSSKEKKTADKSNIKYAKKEKKAIPENTRQLRRLYNNLMKKDKLDKSNIVKKIMQIIDNKYSDICFKHDGCRILQGSLKYGNNEQKREIINKLIPNLWEIIKGKYSIYLSIKVLKYAENAQKEKILKDIIIPNFKQLLKYSGGITFFKNVFLYSTTSFQDQLVNLYIKDYFCIPLDQVKLVSQKENKEKVDIDNIIIEQTESEEVIKIRNKIKLHIETQLTKGIHRNFVFHGFLNKIFDLLDAKTQIYISEIFDDDFLPFLDSNLGFEVACKIYSVAQAKTRKKIIKGIREKINDLILNDNELYFIIKIILFTDDTKIIEKNFLKIIIEKLNDSFHDHLNLLKVLWNIIYPFNKKCNSNYYENVLSYSQPYSNKKDLNKRQSELIEYIYDSLYKILSFETRFLLTDRLYSILLEDYFSFLIQKKDINKIESLLNHIIDLIDIDIKSNKDTIDNCILNDKVGHISIKRILKVLLENEDKSINKYGLSFAEKIAALLKTNLEAFINNKAIFIVVQIMENKYTEKLLINELQKFKGDILKNKDNKKLAGMVILAKLLSK